MHTHTHKHTHIVRLRECQRTSAGISWQPLKITGLTTSHHIASPTHGQTLAFTHSRRRCVSQTSSSCSRASVSKFITEYWRVRVRTHMRAAMHSARFARLLLGHPAIRASALHRQTSASSAASPSFINRSAARPSIPINRRRPERSPGPSHPIKIGIKCEIQHHVPGSSYSQHINAKNTIVHCHPPNTRHHHSLTHAVAPIQLRQTTYAK